nr:MAG TPA: hypothetical protein [Caudoviricetes sp.]
MEAVLLLFLLSPEVKTPLYLPRTSFLLYICRGT